jgi:hypothetical protein
VSTFLARRATLVTSATPDYSANDAVGAKAQFIQRTPGGSGRLSRLTLKSIDTIGVDSLVYLLDSDPAATTIADNAAFALAAADRTRLIETVSVLTADWVTHALTGLFVAKKTLDVPYFFSGGNRDIWAVMVALGAINLSATNSIEIILGGEVD